MTTLKPLLARNRSWALQKCQHDPDYFEKWVDGQRPHSLWIGCSDSRVPAEVLTGSQPGELFVHRNIANMLDPADDNVMSVLQYALHYLEVERVVLCGHYGCGGVQAALSLPTLPLAQESSALARRIGQLRHTLHHEIAQIADGCGAAASPGASTSASADAERSRHALDALVEAAQPARLRLRSGFRPFNHPRRTPLTAGARPMNTLRQDSLAGIVVFLVALPLCLGIAQASGLPPFVGLLTGIIGGLVVTALSPSRFAVSGPAAGLVTIVVAAIESLGSFSVFLMALVLAGVLQLLFGILRAGRFISLVPASVIKGMLAAIGILLIMQQIPVALGTAEETGLADVVQGNAAFSLSAIAVAAGGLLVLWLWGSPLIRRVKSLRWIPGPLIAVLLGCVTTLLLTHFAPQQLAALPRITLPAFGSLGDLLGELESPAWSAWRNPSVWVVAVTLALVASLETLLSQEALKKLRPQNPPPSPNREMVAQGVGNLLSGVLGAMPITAVIVRSSVNVSNGAQSKLSIFIHGVLLLICGLWFSGLLTLIPLASLAAVLLYTGYKLATPRLFIEQFRQGAAQYVPFLATIGGIIAFGMLAGIGIGLATQMAFSLWRSHRHSLQLARYDDHYVLRIQQNLTFMHNPHLRRGIPCSTLSGLSRQPQGNEHEHH